MNHACLYAIAALFLGAAAQAAFDRNIDLVVYSIAAAALQLSVISMGK